MIVQATSTWTLRVFGDGDLEEPAGVGGEHGAIDAQRPAGERELEEDVEPFLANLSDVPAGRPGGSCASLIAGGFAACVVFCVW